MKYIWVKFQKHERTPENRRFVSVKLAKMYGMSNWVDPDAGYPHIGVRGDCIECSNCTTMAGFSGNPVSLAEFKRMHLKVVS